MARWITLDRCQTRDGLYELRQREAGEFHITIDGRILMNSRASRSEEALAQLALESLETPRAVLVGGLGMGITLRRALELLPEGARVVVVELQPQVARWCREALVETSGGALADPRVSLRIANVASAIRDSDAGEWDAIVLDLFEGPHARTLSDDPLYGDAALDACRHALRPGGALAVWSEDPAASFERRLTAHGFEARVRRPGRGGRRHAVYVARRT